MNAPVTLKAPKKKLLLFTHDGLFSHLALQQLTQSESVEVVGLVYSSRIRTKKGSTIGDIARVISTSGVGYALYLALGTDLYSLIRRLLGKSTSSSQARKQSIPIHITKDINQPGSVRWIEDQQPDTLLSFYFNQRFENPLLQLSQTTAVNIHPSALPGYRGVDPVFRALGALEPQLGVSVHIMDEHFDQGRLLAQIKLARSQTESVLWHTQRLMSLGLSAFLTALNQPDSFDSKIEIQGGHYDSWPTPDEVKNTAHSLWHWRDIWQFYIQAKL